MFFLFKFHPVSEYNFSTMMLSNKLSSAVIMFVTFLVISHPTNYYLPRTFQLKPLNWPWQIANECNRYIPSDTKTNWEIYIELEE